MPIQARPPAHPPAGRLLLVYMRWMTARASSRRPRMTSHRGDSGSRHSETAGGMAHVQAGAGGGEDDGQDDEQVGGQPGGQATSISAQWWLQQDNSRRVHSSSSSAGGSSGRAAPLTCQQQRWHQGRPDHPPPVVGQALECSVAQGSRQHPHTQQEFICFDRPAAHCRQAGGQGNAGCASGMGNE